MGVTSNNFTKIGYIFFQLFWVLLGISTYLLGNQLVDLLPEFMSCSYDSEDYTVCIGPSGIIRVSFVLACFHAIVLCIILARNKFASIFHDGCWIVKFILVTVGLVGSLWITTSFFQYYM